MAVRRTMMVHVNDRMHSVYGTTRCSALHCRDDCNEATVCRLMPHLPSMLLPSNAGNAM